MHQKNIIERGRIFEYEYIINEMIFLNTMHLKRGIILRDTLYDKLIFNKIRDLFGGNVIRTATGSAPIAKEVMEFSRSLFSCPVS